MIMYYYELLYYMIMNYYEIWGLNNEDLGAATVILMFFLTMKHRGRSNMKQQYMDGWEWPLIHLGDHELSMAMASSSQTVVVITRV